MFWLLCVLLLIGCNDVERVDMKKMNDEGIKLGLRQLRHKPENVKSTHALHRHFMAAGMGAIYGLFFVKDICADDKVLLEDSVQAALDADEDREWQGKTVSASIAVGEKYMMNGFMCRKFTQTFVFQDNTYMVENKACKIYLNKDGSGYWVLEDTVENYFNS